MEATQRVVVLGVDDTFVHVYPDASVMLKQNDIGYGPEAKPFPVELFLENGQRLAGVYDETWRVSQLVPCGKDDRDALRDRLVHAIAKLGRSLSESADRLALFGLSPEDVVEVFAEEATERSSLEDMLTLFEFDHDPLVMQFGAHPDDGSWLHKLLRH